MSDPLVSLRNVIKDYGDEVKTRVLHGIDLTIERGEFVSLIGPSGSGKSTLLNLIGLLDRPTGGEIKIEGKQVDELDDDQLTALRAETLGFVFQFHHLIGALTACENVMMPLAIHHGQTNARLHSQANKMLAAVGLGDRGKSLPRQLSGGQQQRVAIARAIVAQPALVLADEPSGNLDTETSEEVFALLRKLNRENGLAFLIVTHDLRIAKRTDRVIEIIDGRIVSDQSPARLG